jgi:hypothetical protein
MMDVMSKTSDAGLKSDEIKKINRMLREIEIRHQERSSGDG